MITATGSSPACADYERSLTDAGVRVAGAALQPASTATCVQIRDGRRVVTDGSCVEPLDRLYVLDLPDLDAALDWAARCPGAQRGTVEVRPVRPVRP